MTTDPGDIESEGVGKGPDAFRTISEVAEELGLPQHVLRFWETRFPQVKPIKRGGGRRYYRPNDVDLLRGVKQLLYGEGYTIRGVQRILREQGGRKAASAAGASVGAEPRRDPSLEAPASGERARGLMQADAGPDFWAPAGKTAAAPAPADPETVLESYGVRSEAEPFPESVEPPAAGLTERQIARLSSALDELRACRRLLDGRS
ncbi:MerR family transcriptional regulator [Hansschlegelia plantiphila]|uniref:MerR family transcriptional regulator n=1 Tax=Hansschlegelia plantiphila TaxID=374655 RepID=A0A9W6J5C0_9HYPH|nr:MerR family transcriptional regulator [Hansschlegelia plantiphila]GLK69548.1 MerR family transcriptional regulator [Hansschlegelia plantiphila]